ncbi:hypothetical protein [Clostridium algidicarnis]|uniref:Uncharacterized protein n=1 Tax=Clostridium algidicarnis TaxID=37659 RepID=A0ABS6C5Z9_9CLOT|nr:hypothetical protein [Clostridium algidicarnis]MBU3220918.1 hypothetical protein [Clostridium algidicarnis]
MNIEQIKNQGLKETEYNDSFFKRLTKSKYQYYKEGYTVCGDYYARVLDELKKDIKESKDALKPKIKEKDEIIAILKNKLMEYQNQEKGYSNEEAETAHIINECLQLFIEEKILLEDTHFENLPERVLIGLED